MIETIRISQPAKEQLSRLKRKTGIQNWNVLCRWALVASLREVDPPVHSSPSIESNVEMSWRTFAGDTGSLYYDLVKMRSKAAGLPLDDQSIDSQFRLHLHRGIAYLSALPVKTISEFVQLANT
jgi:DNA sulfur modification protein DndE